MEIVISGDEACLQFELAAQSILGLRSGPALLSSTASTSLTASSVDKKQAEAYFNLLKRNTQSGYLTCLAVLRKPSLRGSVASCAPLDSVELAVLILAAQVLGQLCRKQVSSETDALSSVVPIISWYSARREKTGPVVAQLVVVVAVLLVKSYIAAKMSLHSSASTFIIESVQSIREHLPMAVVVQITGAVADVCLSNDFSVLVPTNDLGFAKADFEKSVLAHLVKDNLSSILHFNSGTLLPLCEKGSNASPIISEENFVKIAAVACWMQLCMHFDDLAAAVEVLSWEPVCLTWVDSSCLLFAHKFVRSYLETCWSSRQDFLEMKSLGQMRQCCESCMEVLIGFSVCTGRLITAGSQNAAEFVGAKLIR
jgi:hypothetical protein